MGYLGETKPYSAFGSGLQPISKTVTILLIVTSKTCKVAVNDRFTRIVSRSQKRVFFNILFQIEKLRVNHDNSGRDPDWYLEEVTIDVPDKGEQYIFPCHRWLMGSQRNVDLIPGK